MFLFRFASSRVSPGQSPHWGKIWHLSFHGTCKSCSTDGKLIPSDTFAASLWTRSRTSVVAFEGFSFIAEWKHNMVLKSKRTWRWKAVKRPMLTRGKETRRNARGIKCKKAVLFPLKQCFSKAWTSVAAVFGALHESKMVKWVEMLKRAWDLQLRKRWPWWWRIRSMQSLKPGGFDAVVV